MEKARGVLDNLGMYYPVLPLVLMAVLVDTYFCFSYFFFNLLRNSTESLHFFSQAPLTLAW